MYSALIWQQGCRNIVLIMILNHSPWSQWGEKRNCSMLINGLSIIRYNREAVISCIWPWSQTLDTFGPTLMPLKKFSSRIYDRLWLWFDPSHEFVLFKTKLIAYSALHSFCQASWYFTGSSCREAGSRSAESIYWVEGEKKRRLENWLYTAVWFTSTHPSDTLTLTSSLWLMARAECSRALITDAYESENFVYFPTSAMEQCSNSLSDLKTCTSRKSKWKTVI